MGRSADAEHEVLTAFERIGCRLNKTLYEMLGEHAKHHTERRGCGFTQATRHLGAHINQPRRLRHYDEILLFADRDSSRLRAIMSGAEARGIALSWRNLDLRPPPEPMRDDLAWCTQYELEARRQADIRALPEQLELEESRLLAAMVRDVILPRHDLDERQALPPWPDKLEIGSCALAEKFFLELAKGFVRRKGLMNVIVSDQGEPLLVEKLNLGDDHSCVTVAPVTIHGVPLPPGCLVGVTYGPDVALRDNREIRGAVFPASRCEGFRFLRLTTLAVSPSNRKRAFTVQFQAQIDGGFFSPGALTIEDLYRVASKQL